MNGLLAAPIFAAGSNAALVTFLIYVAAVFGLAALSNQLMKSKSFGTFVFKGLRCLENKLKNLKPQSPQ